MNPKKISELTQDPSLLEKFHAADRDGDGALQASELDRDRDGRLDRLETGFWGTPEESYQVQRLLYQADLLPTMAQSLGPLESWLHFRSPSNRGDPFKGHVLFVPQIHDIPEHSEPERQAVGEFQFEILKWLIETGHREIFSEGECENTLPGDQEPELRSAFPTRRFPEFPEDLTYEQKDLLATYGAALVYANLYPGVTVHKTVPDCETADEWILRKSDPFVSQEDKRHYRMDVRERLAAAEVRRFLEKSPPYTDAVLIFGADHVFSDDLPDFALIEAHSWDAKRRFVARVFTE